MPFVIIGFSLLVVGLFLLKTGKKRKDPGLMYGAFGMILGSVLLFLFFWILSRISGRTI